ncbi:MAG: hypothetical protein K2P51_03445 [Rhabdochlamydiaceae bacterium]|nr:hypothetical protein [Rhabdochlamydiaceae bacterium]
MPIDHILFSSVSRESGGAKKGSLLQDTEQYVNRSKGIKSLFSLGACGFSWALLAPIRSDAVPYLQQGRSVSKFCKSTFRVPKLALKGSSVWNKGGKVRGSGIAVAKQISKDPLSNKVLRKVLRVATATFDWLASFMKWGCGVLSLADKKYLRTFYKELPDQIAQVGVSAGLSSTGMKLMNTSRELSSAFQTKLPQNPLIVEARAKALDNLIFKTASLALKFFSLILSALSAFALYPVAPLLTHISSTVSLGFGITALKIEPQPVLNPRRVSLID